ncbi:NADP-dependent oxidoreductase [Arthrobacter monumenti]
MKAAYYEAFGGPEVLKYGEQPEPKLGPDTVLVDIKASSVNPVDWAVMGGYLDSMSYAHFPVITGWDLAGVVKTPGPAVEEFQPGDEVIGYVRMDVIGHGTFAEQVAAPVRTLARKPENVNWEQAATIPLTGLTAYQSLVHFLQVSDGDTVLIHGGSGGVGTYAVQIARAKGARVIATASERNHDFLKDLGAEPTSYGEGAVDRFKALAPDGIDAILDLSGGDELAPSVELLRTPGRVVSVVNPGVKEMGGHYVFVRPDPEDLAALTELVEAGKVTPVLTETFELKDAAKAFELSMGGHVRGKIAIRVQ